MTEFQANSTAVAANSALKSSLKTMARARRSAVLWFGEILERKLFLELGYSSMNQYAEVELGTAELERARCDCQISEPGDRNASAIPPATRRKVLARDRHQCQAPGCSNTHYLEIHHKTPRVKGGTNAEENLTTLCSACHRLFHSKGHALVRSPQVSYHTRQTKPYAPSHTADTSPPARQNQAES